MRIVNYHGEHGLRFGLLTERGLVDPLLNSEANASQRKWFANTIAFIAGGEDARAAVEQVLLAVGTNTLIPLEQIRLGPPIMPSTILCSGSNYRSHNKEKSNTPISGKEPEFFIKTSDSVIGPGDAIIYDPLVTQKLDCETELAVVIGKPGRHIPVDRALDHVFGYTIVNDVTARDRQVRTAPGGVTWYELGRGKAFDTSAPTGPAIVTSNEIGDPQKLHISTRINGELRQSSTTAEMIWSCAELVHFFSVNFTLRPGMVILTGTPAGTAWSSDKELGGSWVPEPGLVPATRYCLPGDEIECEVEKIGVLRNRVQLAEA